MVPLVVFTPLLFPLYYYLVNLLGTAPRGLSPLQKNGGEGYAICFWILHHRLMRHREVMRGEWNWWPVSGVEYWSVHLYLVHTLEDSMAVTIGYYRHKSSAELKKALEAWYFQNWMIRVEFTMWPTFVQKTNCLFFCFSVWTFANLYSGRVLRFSY